jgi:precorrin-3B synthase
VFAEADGIASPSALFRNRAGPTTSLQNDPPMPNPVEVWKSEKHGFDVWPNVLDYAARRVPMRDIDAPELERMKWHGVFYRKRDAEGSYMLRIRLTACELTAEQAKEIAYIAFEFGHGIVDVTTRANIQVQGLEIQSVPRAIERLQNVGLSCKQTGHDNIRNVFCHPLSGVDPDELVDVRPLCREITAIFLDDRKYSDLPRKFNIAVCGRRVHSSHYWSQDLSLLATPSVGGEVAFQVLVAGTQGQNPRLGWHLPVLVYPDQVVPFTRALLDLFREQGAREKRDAARLRYLVERIGVPGVLEALGSALPFSLEPCPTPPAPPHAQEDLIGWFGQRQPDVWTLGVCVLLGRLGWQQLEGLALAARQWGSGMLRTTPDQGVALIDIPTGFRDACATACAAVGLSPWADSLDRSTVACTGKQFCNIAVTDTKGHMLQLIERLRERKLALHGIRIHMSGCPSSCAQHHTADIGLKGVRVRRLLGTREGFDVYLGGGIAGDVHLGVLYKLGVDVDQLPQLIEEVVGEYYLRREPGLTFSAYWREKLRAQQAAKVGDGEFTPPVWVCENCQFRHLAEDPPVYCPKCAGLRRNFARLDASDGAPASAPAAGQSAAGDSGFIVAAREDQVVGGAGLQVEVNGQELALFRLGNEIRAIDNACPHSGGPLAEGSLCDGVVTCPWHGWTFDVRNGQRVSHPECRVRVYPTRIENGQVLVQLGAPPAAESP